jgi:hypothetical protein
MTTTPSNNKVEKKSKSLEDEINTQRAKLKKLEDRYKEQQRKEREKNYKLVVELLKAEKLDLVSIDQWRMALPIIKKSLGTELGGSVKK